MSHLLLSCFPKYGSHRTNDSLRKTDEKNTESRSKIHSNDWGMILNNAHAPSAGNFIYARIIMHMHHCTKADRYKSRFFCAKFLDKRAKARSEVLTKRFLRINSRARSILEGIEASCFRQIPNKWLK